MNYFEFHIGDYESAASHLSATEDGIYFRLIRRYYASERPLPAEKKDVLRIARARTREEKAAVDTVLREFFVLADDGWRNPRCDEEIARFQAKREKAKNSANARWNAMQSDSERNANAMRTHSEGNATRARIHEPDPNTQDPDLVAPNGATRPQTASRPEDRTPHQAIIDLYHELLPHNPKVRAWTAARQALLRQRWKEDPDLEGWRRYFEYVAKSPFLTGRAKPREGQPPFVADLEWLIRESNQTKVIEGKFHRG